MKAILTFAGRGIVVPDPTKNEGAMFALTLVADIDRETQGLWKDVWDICKFKALAYPMENSQPVEFTHPLTVYCDPQIVVAAVVLEEEDEDPLNIGVADVADPTFAQDLEAVPI